jgi:hypothetical protein
MHLNARTNEYQKIYPAFDDTPKAVVGAVAYSLALRLCNNNHEQAAALLRDEWAALHAAGIVPQKPRAEHSHGRPDAG